MQSIKSITNNDNMKVLNNTAETQENCNCRNKNNCLVDGKYLTPNIIYEAQVTSNQLNYKQKIYIGTTKKNISNTGLTTTQNHSTLNTMKTTWNYLKNT